MNDGLNELYEIIEIEDLDLRQKKFGVWIRDWLELVQDKQSILDSSRITAENMDTIKKHLAYGLVDELMDICVKYEISKTKTLSEVIAFRRKRRF